MPEVFEVFITKYVTTRGIYVEKVKDCGNGMVAAVGTTLSTYFHGESKDWHRTRESAVKRAREVIAREIESIDAKKSKLVKMYGELDD